MAAKLIADKEVRDLVLAKGNETELQKLVLNKMIAAAKSDPNLLKQLSDEIWAKSTDDSLKNLSDSEKLGLVNISLNHPEAFDGTIQKDKLLDWLKDDAGLKDLYNKLHVEVDEAAAPSHQAGGGLV